MERLLQDVTYALRALARNRAFAIAAIVSLALPIAVDASIFSIVNALLLRTPTVDRPHELLGVYSDLGPRGPIRYISVSYPDYTFYRDHASTFSGMGAYNDLDLVLGEGTDGESVLAEMVSGSFFEVLGLRPAIGRMIVPSDDSPSQPPVAVIDQTLWQNRFQRDPNVIGKTVHLNRQAFTIVGVLPAQYTGLTVGPMRQVYIPLATQPLVMSGTNMLASHGNRWLNAFGRMKPGVQEAQAKADLEVLTSQLQKEFPATNRRLGVATTPLRMVPLTFKGLVVNASTVFMIAVVFVLLISCANLTNLLLMRAHARRTEFATRLALGAARGRLVRQLLTESLVLGALGGLLGFALAVVLARTLSNVQRPPGPLSLVLSMTIDWRVGLFALGLAVLTGVGIGLLPALWASRSDLTAFLKQDTQRAGASTSRTNRVLVTAQVCVSVVLLAGAGLALRSLAKAQAIDPGFRPDGVYAASFQLQRQNLPEGRVEQFYRQVQEHLRAVPGVQAVSTASHMPMGGMISTKSVVIDAHQPPPGQEHFEIDTSQVSPGYFQTMGIALVSGRDFDERDASAAAGEQTPVLINQTMAKEFWSGQDPLGKVIRVDEKNDKGALIVIGVVKDSKYRSIGEAPRSFVYRPMRFAEEAPWGKQLLVKTAGGASQLGLVRTAIEAVDASLPPARFQSLEEQLAGVLFPARLLAVLLATFGALAFALQTVGLYGVTAYAVNERRREMAIRRALGAPRFSLIKVGVGGPLLLVAFGAAAGVLLALWATRGLGGYLYGITPSDAPTLAAVVLLQLMAGLLAAYTPMHRTMELEPSVALRDL
jgi:putative ABC transport system permease protein